MEHRDEENRPLNPSNGQSQLFEDKQSIPELLIITVFSIILNAITCFLFYKYSTEESKHGGEECHYLRDVAYYFAIYSLIVLVLTIILNPILLISEAQILRGLFEATNTIEGCIRTLFLITLFVALIVGVQCGALRILTMIYLIFCVVTYMAIFIISQMDKEKQQ